MEGQGVRGEDKKRGIGVIQKLTSGQSLSGSCQWRFPGSEMGEGLVSTGMPNT